MGNFLAHLQLGMVLMLFNARWLYCTLLRYHLCRRDATFGKPSSRRYKSSISFPCKCNHTAPIEQIFLTVASGLNIIFEFAASFDMFGGYGLIMNGQHITIITFYFMFGISTLLRHYKMLAIPNVEYIFFMLANIMNALSMWYHVVNKSGLESQMHLLFGMLAIILSCGVVVEMLYRYSILATVMRIASGHCMGTWFITIGFVLFPLFGEPLDQDSPMSLKIMAMMFMWNAIGTIVAVVLTSTVTHLKVRTMSSTEVQRNLKFSYGIKYHDDDDNTDQEKNLLNSVTYYEDC